MISIWLLQSLKEVCYACWQIHGIIQILSRINLFFCKWMTNRKSNQIYESAYLKKNIWRHSVRNKAAIFISRIFKHIINRNDVQVSRCNIFQCDIMIVLSERQKVWLPTCTASKKKTILNVAIVEWSKMYYRI